MNNLDTTLPFPHQSDQQLANWQESSTEFVNFLFDKLVAHVDTDLIDLHDDDTAGIDALMFRQLELDL
jgi:hypothetical protein